MCDIRANEGVTVFFFLVLKIADRQRWGAFQNKEVHDLCLSFCKDGWNSVRVIQPKKCNSIYRKIQFISQEMVLFLFDLG